MFVLNKINNMKKHQYLKPQHTELCLVNRAAFPNHYAVAH